MINFDKLKDKIFNLKENNIFYKDLYKNIDINKISNFNDFKENIPIIDKKYVFDKNRIFDLINIEDGLISPSAGTTSNNFSFRYELNSINDESFNKLFFLLLNQWFDITNKKTLIINSYPLGVSFPKANFTIINTTVREDIIFFALDYFADKFESIIIVGQPHFIKFIVDHQNFDKLNKNKEKISFLLGGEWFPLTFENYILKKTFGNNFSDYSNRIKSTLGTAETGLGLLFDFSENIRRNLSKNTLNEIVPIVYQYLPERFFIEEVNDEMVISKLVNSNPDLIRYNTGDKIKFPSKNEIINIPEKFHQNIVFVYGRGENFKEKAKIYNNLLFDFNIAQKVNGNFYLDKENNLFIRLNPNIEKSNKLVQEIKEVFDYNVVLFDYEEYPFKKSLDRKPI